MKLQYILAAATALITAGTAQAQGIQVTSGTNVTIGGLLAVGVKNSSLSQGNSSNAAWASRNALPSETHVDDNTSRLIIGSTSKITDGWNVVFSVESRFTADTRPGDNVTVGLGATTPVANATGFADGDTFGGVSSPYGTIIVGKSTLYYTDTISAGYLAPVLEAPGEGQRVWDANGLATFNILSSYLAGAVVGGTFQPGFAKNILGNTRSRNVIRYNSIFYKPTGKDLLDFSIAYTKNAAGAENEAVPNYAAPVIPASANNSTYASGSTVYARMRYNGYGFSASGSYLDQKFQGIATTAANTELKAMRLGISYKVAGFKAGVVYDSTNSVNGVNTGGVLSDATRTAFAIPVSYTMGDHGFYATYATAGNTSSYADSGAKQINFGYDYALTKRAFVGLWVTKLANGANAYYAPFLAGYSFGGSTVQKGETFTQFGVNLNYWF
jgi:hypothetical protein